MSAKWLSATEVERCLLLHPSVEQVVVVGVTDATGLVKQYASFVSKERRDSLAEELKVLCTRSARAVQASARGDLPRFAPDHAPGEGGPEASSAAAPALTIRWTVAS